MRTRMTAAAAALALAAMAGGTAARAAAVTRVPCDPAALASAISGAASGDTLILAARCTYVLTTALPQVSEDLTIAGNRATLERSTAGGTPDFTILTLEGGSITITELSFRNGRGAIAVSNDARLTVDGGTFTGNVADNGGAIDAAFARFGPRIIGVTFAGNSAAGNGGAVYDDTGGGMSVAGSTFTGNTAGGDGGAIWDFGEAGAISSSKFRENAAAGNGGAIWVNEDDGESFDHDAVRDNIAGGSGGGIYGSSGGSLGITISGSDLSDNQALAAGGAAWIPGGLLSPNAVTGSTLRGNRAAYGGAIFADLFSSLRISDDDIVDNRAGADGAGLYDDGPGSVAALSVDSTTFFANRAAGNGGAIFNGFTALPVSGSSITENADTGGGGGIYNDRAQGGSAALTDTPVTGNHPGNCRPAGSADGCSG